MSGKIQFEDEFNYRPKNTTRGSFLKTPAKTRTSFTQKLVKSGICKNERTAERLLLIIAIVSFSTGILFTMLILNPTIKYKFIFTVEGKHILTDQEAQEYVNQRIFNNTEN